MFTLPRYNKEVEKSGNFMDLETFLQELGQPVNAGLDAVEPVFIEKLKERLQVVADHYNETELQQEEQWLRGFIAAYFAYVQHWVGREAVRFKDVKEFDTAPALKKQAKEVVTELENYISEFVSCYMHIGRFMTLLREEIRKEEIKAVGDARRIKWTADAGVVIARYRKEKKALLERMERLGKARTVLERIEGDFDVVRGGAITLFGGRDKAEPYTRRLFASLRVSDFRKARKAVQEIVDAKKKFGLDQKTAKQTQDNLEAGANRILELMEKEQELLVSEEKKLFLRPIETDIAYNNDIKELQKIKAFLAKYHLPYIQYKLDMLSHLKDKLLVLNSLESLMTLYKRLILGIALPLKDIKTVRLYESEILNHVKYLLTGHFTELPKILQRAEETVNEFRQSRSELEEFEKLDLQEIEVSEQQAAQA